MDVAYNFCPACAHPLQDRERFGRTRRTCSRCGFVHFREPKVAVAVLVEDERGRVLLVRRAVLPALGRWAFPSGFMDYDEEPRAAAQREVAEETGLQVQVREVLDVATLGQEDQRQGVIIFFAGRPTGGRLRPGDDVSEVRWFAADEIPYDELAFSGTRRLLVPSSPCHLISPSQAAGSPGPSSAASGSAAGFCHEATSLLSSLLICRNPFANPWRMS
ncbi:MAG: NUDIX hydrolase [Chloroflexi bacterium]|nr:NUDIX hydrolase [Chloroflexota bacterium]